MVARLHREIQDERAEEAGDNNINIAMMMVMAVNDDKHKTHKCKLIAYATHHTNEQRNDDYGGEKL